MCTGNSMYTVSLVLFLFTEVTVSVLLFLDFPCFVFSYWLSYNGPIAAPIGYPYWVSSYWLSCWVARAEIGLTINWIRTHLEEDPQARRLYEAS